MNKTSLIGINFTLSSLTNIIVVLLLVTPIEHPLLVAPLLIIGLLLWMNGCRLLDQLGRDFRQLERQQHEPPNLTKQV